MVIVRVVVVVSIYLTVLWITMIVFLLFIATSTMATLVARWTSPTISALAILVVILVSPTVSAVTIAGMAVSTVVIVPLWILLLRYVRGRAKFW